MKNNNKGFSLVELIIVIAIMAVLVGVLAPTYMQYVEKSKKSNDVSTVDTIINAVEIAAIDPETQSDTWSTLTIVIDNNSSNYSVTQDAGTQMSAVVKRITGSDVKFKHNWGKVGIKVTRGSYGTVTFAWSTDATNHPGTNDFKAYASSITKIS